jgi:TrmH family RNA methyltransferase
MREREGRFLAEGPQAVREALADHRRRRAAGRPALVHEVFADPAAAERHGALLGQAEQDGVRITHADTAVLAALSDTVTPQGLVAVCSLVTVDLETVTAAAPGPSLVAVLAHVRDPGNAGTVLRTADAAGAGAVVLSAESVDPHNPKCVRATAGSLFHLPVVSDVTLPEAIEALRRTGLTILAADGDPASHSLDELADQAEAGAGLLAGRTAWLFGNEAWGLSEAERALADHVVRVPIHGGAESLNLASAAAICLYASARAHRGAGRTGGARGSG